MVRGRPLRQIYGICAGIATFLVLGIAVVFATVSLFGDRAFEQGLYELSPAAANVLLFGNFLACLAWGYVHVRIGGARSIGALVCIVVLLMLFSMYSVILKPVTLQQRDGPVDWLNLAKYYTPSRMTDLKGLMVLVLGLGFGARLVKPEQLELEKV